MTVADDQVQADAGWVQGVLLAIIPAVVIATVVVAIPIIPKLTMVFANTPAPRCSSRWPW
jgi:hypothetical protein